MNFNPSELLAILPSLSMSEREEVLRLLEEMEDRQAVEDARADFLSFVRVMYPEYMTGPHHKYLADLLQDVERGVKDRVAVSVGPRFGKSLLISTYYPAWYLGHHPDHYVILASHTADLAVDFSRKVRNIINSPEYRRIFPETVVSSDSKAAGKWSTTRGGEFFAVGVGGAIAGRGAHLLLVDDPFSEQDILSGKTETFEKAYQWFTFGARTRLMASGAVAILHTRWSPADLIGRLITDMAANPQADQYEVVEFPAILPSGRALWPEMWPLEKLERTRASMPAFQWSAQYQQQPTSEEGAIIAREKWRRWEREKPPKTDWLLMSIDTAYTVQTRSDYSACTLWGVFHNEDGEPGIILINAWRAKMEFPELKRRVMIDNEKWRPDGIIIEAKAAGYPLIQEMRRSGIPVQAYTPSRGNDKMARLNAVSDLFESSMVWAPRGKWADEVIEEVAQFPAGAHDDYVDTCVLHSSKIIMADGTTKMMSEIRVGDWVATPGGASRVTAVLEQGNKPLWELRVGDRVLHATGDHRVMTTRGWIRLDKLIPGEDCVVCYPPPELVGCRSKIREFARKWFGSMAGITDGIRTARTFTFAGISPGRAASCTGIYGSSTMVPSRKDTISTTRTRTRATIASRIWSAIRAAAISPSTSGPTPNGTGGRGGNSTSPPSGSRLPNGTRPKKAGRGTGNTRKILSLLRGKLSGSTDSRKNPLLVSGVEPKEQLQTAGKSSVVQSAGRRSPDTEGVSTVTFTHTTDRVMDLTVEGEHCFFAEGILVHNCSMALMRIRKGGLVRLPDDEDDDPLAGYMARRRYYY